MFDWVHQHVTLTLTQEQRQAGIFHLPAFNFIDTAVTSIVGTDELEVVVSKVPLLYYRIS